MDFNQSQRIFIETLRNILWLFIILGQSLRVAPFSFFMSDNFSMAIKHNGYIKTKATPSHRGMQ
jgi:hypothetical protein